MKKHNAGSQDVHKQRRQLASKARRQRRVAARTKIVELSVTKRLKPLANLIKMQEKQIKELKELLATPARDLPLPEEVAGAENT